jgi:hypothetical protein
MALSAGTVVPTYSEALQGWSAAVVVHVDASPHIRDTVSLLELDWAGPAPPTLAQARTAEPLRLTHHRWDNRLSYLNHANRLPRNYEVVGQVSVPDLPPADPWTPRWTVGQQLAMQRRWDLGERRADPRQVKCTAVELLALPYSPDVWEVEVVDIDGLDCREVTTRCPNVSELSLRGHLGELTNADALNALSALKVLIISDLFGMKASDVYHYAASTRLEALYLSNIPEQYAAATRKAWRSQATTGTTLEVRGARKPEWIAENYNNPFREWDMRNHISRPRYLKVLALYRQTRTDVLAELAVAGDAGALERIGREYGEALNVIDGTRSPFIETEERQDLHAALEQMVGEAGLSPAESQTALKSLTDGLDRVRSW